MDLDVITINMSVIIKRSVYHENQASVCISLAIHFRGAILKFDSND